MKCCWFCWGVFSSSFFLLKFHHRNKTYVSKLSLKVGFRHLIVRAQYTCLNINAHVFLLHATISRTSSRHRTGTTRSSYVSSVQVSGTIWNVLQHPAWPSAANSEGHTSPICLLSYLVAHADIPGMPECLRWSLAPMFRQLIAPSTIIYI